MEGLTELAERERLRDDRLEAKLVEVLNHRILDVAARQNRRDVAIDHTELRHRLFAPHALGHDEIENDSVEPTSLAKRTLIALDRRGSTADDLGRIAEEFEHADRQGSDRRVAVHDENAAASADAVDVACRLLELPIERCRQMHAHRRPAP